MQMQTSLCQLDVMVRKSSGRIRGRGDCGSGKRASGRQAGRERERGLGEMHSIYLAGKRDGRRPDA